MQLMHRYTEDTEELAKAIVAYARGRIANPQPLDRTVPRRGARRPRRRDDLARGHRLGGGAPGLGRGARARHDLDRPPGLLRVRARRPTKAAALFDLIVGASSTIAAGWIDGAGAIWAENQTLRWLADLAGMPAEAGGVFVSGGSAGNLSALVTARHAAARERDGRPARWRFAACDTVHSSVAAAARVMDVDVLDVPHDERGRLTGRGAARDARRRRRRRHLRGGRERRRDERRHGRRPRGRGRRLRRARDLVPRGRRVRRRRPARPLGPARSTTGSSAPTPSSWTRTSGCSRPTTRARSCTATRRCALAGPPPGGLLPRHRARPRPTGTPPTTPTTSRDAPAGSRCGSRSRRTAPTPTATRSSRCSRSRARPPREIRGAPRPRAADGARPLGGALPPRRAGRPTTTSPGGSGSSTPRSPSCSPPRGTARRSARLCFLNPRTTMDHVHAVLGTMV